MKLLLTFLGSIRFIPTPILSFFGKILGNFFYYILPFRHKVIKENICKTIGKNLSEREINQIIKKNYIHYAYLIFEIIILASVNFNNDKYIKKHFGFNNLELIKNGLENNNGIIALCCHIGVWEAQGVLCAKYISPLTVAVKYVNNKFGQYVREKMQDFDGISLVDSRMGKGRIIALLKALKRNEVAVVFHDQFRPAGETVSFFEYSAKTNTTAAVLANKTGSPVLFSYVTRERFGKYTMHFKEIVPLDVSKFENKSEIIINMTKYYNKILEEIIREHPDQWLWAHKRFKGNSNFKY